MDSVEAFDWLLDRFKAYMRNEIIWLDVKEVLSKANELSIGFHEAEINTGSQGEEILNDEPEFDIELETE